MKDVTKKTKLDLSEIERELLLCALYGKIASLRSAIKNRDAIGLEAREIEDGISALNKLEIKIRKSLRI